MTPHSDQHSVAIDGGRLWVGNDGGVYSRPNTGGAYDREGHATDWANHNAGLNTLQYYAVGVGKEGSGVAVSGGLQDNGGSLLRAGAATMVSPFGGDGGDVLVDPDNGCNIVQEYVYLAMSVTNTCGRSRGVEGSIRDIDPGDPAPRFIAPFRVDTGKPNEWVAGGNMVWRQTKGFAIESGTDWAPVFSLGTNATTGAPFSTTALASHDGVTYAGYCGTCNESGFARGIATNASGTWKHLTLPLPTAGTETTRLPNRYISALTIDPADTKHVFAVMNGFSRKFTEGPGAGIGHIFESLDGGTTWKLVDGSGATAFPDVPANDLVIAGGRLIVATDLGVVSAPVGTPGTARTWSRHGSALPTTTVLDLSVGPDNQVYAATHGRGIWRIALPSVGGASGGKRK